MKEATLIGIARRWLRENEIAPVFLPERYQVDVIGYRGTNSVLVRCLTEAPEFEEDVKNGEGRQVGNYRFYLVPYGVMSKEFIHEDWGLLYVTGGGKVEVIVKATGWDELPGEEPAFTNAGICAEERRILVDLLKKVFSKGDIEFVIRNKFGV